ncbi:MAG: serine O-acetyltransferase [bacterium]
MQKQLSQYSIEIGNGQRLAGLISAAVSGIQASLGSAGQPAARRVQRLPALEELESIIRGLRSVLIPELSSTDGSRHSLQGQLRLSLSQLGLELRHAYVAEDPARAQDEVEAEITSQLERFCESLPELRRLLQTDARAIHDGDPSSRSLLEVQLASPGLEALLHHRVAHQLESQGVPLLPRMLAWLAQRATGIDIHPAASIAEACCIDHGTGLVIGETAVIGRNARIYQGVTLGARSIPLDERGRAVRGLRRHPQLGDDVTVYSGATILGAVEIGSGSVIGGNVWLTHSVPAGSRVLQHDPRTSRFSAGAGI